MTTHTKNWFKGVLQTAAFYGAYLMFAVVGSLVSVICMVPAVLFRGARARGFGQKLIHKLFRFFVGYVRAFGLVELDTSELSGLRESGGLIVAANHPCLLDVVLMVSQMPQTVCLMKGSLARNIVLSGTARLAGYVHNESGLGLVRKCEVAATGRGQLAGVSRRHAHCGRKIAALQNGFRAGRGFDPDACANRFHHGGQ